MKQFKIFIFIIYIIVYLLATKYIYNKLVITLISIPMCLSITILVHEISHFIFFKIFGFSVTCLSIGLLNIKFKESNIKFNICNTSFFKGYCTINMNNLKYNKLIICLAMGGISGLILSLFSLLIIKFGAVSQNCETFLFTMSITGLYSFYITFLNVDSADRKLINKIIKEGIGK